MAVDTKKLTIVTVCRNAERTIERTFASVLANKTDEVEYIVVDGGSRDGTLAIIERFNDMIDRWSSGPDDGIYDAMNKGLALARGEFVCFLNADDWLQPDAMQLLLPQLVSEIDFVFGISLLLRPDGAVDGLFLPAVNNRGRLNDLVYRGTPIAHPALFCRTSLARDLGFRRGLSRAADYDFMIRMVQRARNYTYVPKILANFELGGASSADGNSEIYRVQRDNLAFLVERQLQTSAEIQAYYAHLTRELARTRVPDEAEDIRILRGSLNVGMITRFLFELRNFAKRLIRSSSPQ